MALVVLSLAVSGQPPAHAGDPSQVWKTIESEHFEVHYYEPLGVLAHKVAVAAERSHRTLTVALGHEPSGKTHIVLLDNVDSSNGFASVLPRNDVTLFAAAPPDNSVLADYDDWVFNLVSHEYTHIIHLDTISGIPAWYNKVFGKSWAPNQVQPRWVIEGLATYEESKRSSSGRTRHALFDMIMRVATLEGNERRLDEISSGPRLWPHGNSAYLYGSHFLKYIFDRYGDDKAAIMSKDYGGRAIPYALNRGIARATGKTFVEHYEDWRSYRRARYALQQEAIDRAGPREGRRLTFTGENNLNPRYTRDGRHIVWQRGDGYSLGQFRIMPSGGNVGQSKTYAVIERSGAFDMLGDGSMVVEQTRVFRSDYSYQELHVWDRATGAIEQLTHGKRLSDPSVSPDERQVAFVMNAAGRRQLAVMPLQREAEPRVLWTGPGDYDQAFNPDWSPDGRRIAFSIWRTGGYRDILIVDVATGAVEELAHDRAMDSEPNWSPDGRYLYFSSDRTGIFNVFAWDTATRSLWQVTNVLGCARQPAISPDGRSMVYQGFDTLGYELYEMSLDPAAWSPAPVYIDDRPEPTRLRMDEVEVSAPRPYRALETLAPRSYTLGFVSNSLGQAVQIETEGNDVARHHVYRLAATVGADSGGSLNLGGSYSYRRLWPSMNLSLARTVAERGGYVVDGVNQRYTEEGLRGTAGIGLPVLRDPEGSATLALDYDFDYLRNLDGQLHEDDPNDLVPREPESDVFFAGVALRWSYSDSKGFTYTVGPQDGKDLSLAARLDHPNLGSETTSMTLSYRGTLYRQIPIATHPSIMLRLSGGLRTSDRNVGQFAVGGVPDSQDLVRSLMDNIRISNTGYLRGYEARAAAGPQFHLANIELRQELYGIEHGAETLPVFIRRVHGALLFDAGNAFEGPFVAEDLKAGVGGALRLDFTLGFGEPWTLDLGYAHGLTMGAIGESWFLLTGTL